MTETGTENSGEQLGTLLEKIRAEQNQIESQLHQYELGPLLLHHEPFMKSVVDDEWRENLDRLQQEFFEEKEGMNMGQCFDLALSEKYLGIIYVVELGKTIEPSEDGQIDGLKREYINHLKWMKDQKIVDDEIPRKDAERTLDMRRTSSPDHVVVLRNRPLVTGKTEKDGKIVRFGIQKRMVFSLPTSILLALYDREDDGGLGKDASFMRSIELLLDDHDERINPIRTVYYLVTEVLDDHTEPKSPKVTEQRD